MPQNVLVKIDALDNTKAAFRSLKQSISGLTETTSGIRAKLETLTPTFQKMSVVGTAAFTGVLAGAKKSLDAYAQVERAQRQLEHAILDVSHGTRDQVSEVEKLTAALEKKAGVDADSLKMGVAQLSTFGLTSSSVVALTKSLADLTVNQSGVNATADDYVQSANNMAKAINGQFGILERQGIRFTEAQQQLIQYGTETERVKAIQEGFAQNLRETTDTIAGVDLAGAKMSRTFENITESLGKSLQPTFVKLSETIVPLLEQFGAWAEKNPELLSQIVLITGAIAALTAVIGTVSLAMLALNPIAALIVAAIAAVGFAVYQGTKLMHSYGQTWTGVWETIKGATSTAYTFIQEHMDKIIRAVKAAMDALKQLPGVKIASSAVSGAKAITSTIKDLFRANGGPVAANSPYIVGEQGPELFVPGSSGTIVPNHALAGAGTAPIINLTITGNSFMGERDMAEKVGDQIIKLLGLNQRL